MFAIMHLPLLGMGTWGMGGKFDTDESNFDASVEALRFGFEQGIRLVDVAELHGGGLTERIVGEAIKGYTREDIQIISKVSRDHLKYDEVLRAAEGSLKRLDTSYIDLYMIHKLLPSVALPDALTLKALERLSAEGMVRHIGVSNFNVVQLQEAQKHLASTTIEANEIEYNLLFQEAGNEVAPFCKANGIHLIAHRPLAKGMLVRGENKLLDELARTYEKTPAQISLNFIISQGMTAIPKASDKKHLQENVGALGWKLEEGDIALLRKLDGSVPYQRIQ
ncbi:MAG: hypothetical protein A2W52_01135 [Candidatus Taylorbacteria bacterium RIFCSPHIGHO2_02_49_25]|uniref:NADP-dependent oxidoreductase domain-containing protein n=1 Tax=Candidatus Taylorbacteria bacterium RIFCSPHIGHO2_02_49_25 TaxID=1802305 RepID=A0A1G2MAR9_9BACT|nr:MAG: hypothetical protein UY62_C0008G0013 [Parcubacteria group bacterium GW2011_GWF2_50_9]OHA19184.1 MAG: hypothetical protein A2759_00645 [Candidatus Taylorbacteria bacterium RIFCSPHIGHO2_01_FULL_49_60]OHA20987.1 MAG: hypothetical protein A2W52_01135 [Candidatus Taylorbacteria bacterium RIFCSPHIGHO2_02_49_25]OHA36762.1 MAG: hypothetical protein A3B27_01705 [Candidatus Taylorbacteria bacterium RIFCSPLOWO2_01_FULL_50_130]OHA37286.1 MAG: hypothetical protein A2W65_03380 [Candidatus Taylorbacte